MSSEKTDSTIVSKLNLIEESLDSISGRLDLIEKSMPGPEKIDLPNDSGNLRLLPGIIEKITASQDLDGVLENLLESLSINTERGLIFRWEDGRFESCKSKGFPAGNEADYPHSRELDQLLDTVVGSLQLLISRGDLSRIVPLSSDENPRQGYAILVPMIFGKQVPLVYYGESTSTPDPDLVESAVAIASLVIKNQHLTAMLSHDLSKEKSASGPVPEDGEPLKSDVEAESRANVSTEETEAERAILDSYSYEVEMDEHEIDLDKLSLQDDIFDDERGQWEDEELPGSTIPEESIDEPEPPETDKKKIYNSVEDFDTDVISAEELIRSFNIEMNGKIDDIELPDDSEDETEEESILEVELPEEEVGEEEEKSFPDESDVDEEASVESEEEGDEYFSLDAFSAVKDESEEAPPIDENQYESVYSQQSMEEPGPSPEDLPSEEENLSEKKEEALSFARLLVSEIKLYNEDTVRKGQEEGGLYNLLRDEIDLSREVYENRVSDQVRAESNYFDDELIRILAQGNPELLKNEE